MPRIPARTRVAGYTRDNPQDRRKPILEILCPECRQWRLDPGPPWKDGRIEVLMCGWWIPICAACAAEISPGLLEQNDPGPNPERAT